MKCPICFEGVHESWKSFGNIIESENRYYSFTVMKCPECANELLGFDRTAFNRVIDGNGFLIPLTQKGRPLSDFIPEKYTKLYEESFAILPTSPRASAALSRTCLQLLLREYGDVKPGNLFDEIKQVVDSKQLPTTLATLLDIIRKNGNNAVHPNKNENPCEIISVDHDEAEWGLDILDSLFDHYITKPHTENEKLAKYKKKHEKEDKNKKQSRKKDD